MIIELCVKDTFSVKKINMCKKINKEAEFGHHWGSADIYAFIIHILFDLNYFEQEVTKFDQIYIQEFLISKVLLERTQEIRFIYHSNPNIGKNYRKCCFIVNL